MKKIPRPLSAGEETLALHLRDLKPEREYRFAPDRRWRFDFAFPSVKVAIEAEGGLFSGGRHTRGKGYSEDMVKYNRAAELGWLVLRYSTEAIKKGDANEQIRTVLRMRGHDIP